VTSDAAHYSIAGFSLLENRNCNSFLPDARRVRTTPRVTRSNID